MSQLLQKLIAEIPEQYQDIYGHKEYNKSSSRDCSKREEWIRRIIREIQEKTGKKELRVLDLGCAQGYYSLVAAEMGCNVVGVDMQDINIQICNLLREECNAQCTFQHEKIQTIIDSVQTQEYDIVFLFSVIHHVCNENGFDYARQMLEKLAENTNCILAEMALKEEPLYWSRYLPENYSEWFVNIRFFDELAFFETHLSEIKRPFVFLSNRWCEADGVLYEIGEHKQRSYLDKPIDTGRNYYFCENRKYLVKLFRNVDPVVFAEIRNEKELVEKLSDVSFAPHLISYSDRNNRILEITEIHYGSLLWDYIRENTPFSYQTVFLDVLNNLIELEDRGYYHGDLRSWNVCLDENQHAFLIDFGAIITCDEDTVAENQYGFNGVRISTKRSFISLVYDCLTGNSYQSIARYGAYDLSLFYDFDRIPKRYADFIKKYLIAETSIKSFAEIRELYQETVVEGKPCSFSTTELYQILNSQNKATYYEKASYTSGVSRDTFYRSNSENNQRFAEQNRQITEQNTQIREQQTRICEQETQIREQQARICEQETQIRDQQNRINEQETQIREQQTRINKQETQIHEQQTRISEQETQIREQGIQIHEQIDRCTTITKNSEKDLEYLNDHIQFLLSNPINVFEPTEGNGLKSMIKKPVKKILSRVLRTFYQRQDDTNRHLVAALSDIYRLQRNITTPSMAEKPGSCEKPVDPMLTAKGPRVIQLVSTLNYGDAVGNEVVAFKKLLQEHGYTTEIYAITIHSKIPAGTARYYNQMPSLRTDDLIIYHFASECPIAEDLHSFPCKIILRYHNITPPAFFHGFDSNAEKATRNGLIQVKKIIPYIDECLPVSDFNRKDLISMGYQCPMQILPILIRFTDYEQQPDQLVIDKYADGRTNILFVGRMAPNKKVEDVISAFSVYKTKYDPDARLFLVGSFQEDDKYYQFLQRHIRNIKAKDIIFPGHISFRAILAYYSIASVFVCLSEHEGFCVPLVEAMYFRVPIVAYDCCAVSGTLGDAGLLLRDKKDELVAEAIKQSIGRNNSDKQKEQLSTFDPKVIGEQLIKFIDQKVKTGCS